MEENEKKIQDVLAKLDEKQINYEMQRHPAVDRIDQIADLNLIHPETAAKNLFLRDDKHQHYYLVSIMPQKRVDLKAFRKEIGARHLSFASAEDMEKYLALRPGSVTPMGALNDTEHQVQVYLDQDFQGGLIGVHANANTATVWLDADVLSAFLAEYGCRVAYAAI